MRLVVLTLLCLVISAATAASATATRYPVGFGSRPVARPSAFAPAGHGISFDRVLWTRWGRHRAVGRGRLLVYDNITGSEAYSRTRVTLDRAREGLFHRVRWRYADGRTGYSLFTGGRWVIQA